MSASRSSEYDAIKIATGQAIFTLAVAASKSEPIHPNHLPESRYQALLVSNEPPDESELDPIASVISDTGRHLESLRDEISRLRQSLQERETQHVALANVHAQQKAILSPLRRMPPEVLGEIFAWTLPPGRQRWKVTSSPWVLTHVCHSWRAVSATTSSLWSLIHINFNEFLQSTFPLPMLKTQILRAQKIKLRFYGSKLAETQPQITALECLAQHSTRWEELSLELIPDITLIVISIRGRIPSLRRLWLQWEDEDSPSGICVLSSNCFRTAPSLVDAGLYNDCSSLDNLIPVHQLTIYEMNCSWTT
ncbi:hypothetical protein GGX14DRAFT_506606, partial [Mycena pura]